MLQQQDPALYASESVQRAIHAASGLLAFHTWVGTQDLKDEHLLIAENAAGEFVVAAIDFSYSMQWPDPNALMDANGPPALIQQPDHALVAAIADRIEACSDGRIAEIIDALPDDVLTRQDKDRLTEGLQLRRKKVRAALQQKGWIV